MIFVVDEIYDTVTVVLTQLDLDWMYYHTPAVVLDAKPPFALKTNILMQTTKHFCSRIFT